MRNNIYRSFLKKVLKSEAFVSLAIVFVLALGIIGTSYALYMDVDTDTDYQLVKVGDLDVYIGFDNGDNTVTLSNVTPTDDEIALESSDNVFSFYIYNGGSYTADYSIKLVPDYATTDSDGNSITPNEIKPEYIRFQVCKDNSQNCKDIEKLSDYVTVDENNNITDSKAIYVDELSPKKDSDPTNPSAYYFIRMWLTSEGYGVDGSNYDTNVIGKTIKYKVNVESTNASGLLDNDNTLAGKLLSDERVVINNTIPTFDGIADYKVTGDPTSGELGMFKAEDDYGISYYYRGAQSHNYVNFAGFTWRVVRINGDGSIRIILDGLLSTVKREGFDSVAGINHYYHVGNNDNAYVGYMYGTPASDSTLDNKTPYDLTHENTNNTYIKNNLDKFYTDFIKNDTLGYDYEQYISDTMFCSDKTLASSNIGTDNSLLGYSMNKSYYGAVERLYFKESITIIEKASPSLKCAEGTDNNYSRFTVAPYITEKGVATNGNLTYPIATLSADEMVMAGAFIDTNNTSYYLYNSETINKIWWTMTPLAYNYRYNGGSVFAGTTTTSLKIMPIGNAYLFGYRPVINLKSDVLWASGDGTVGTPYEVKLY